MQEPTKDWIDRTNRDMAECVLDYIKNALDHFGVPKGTFTDDQFDNFVSLYNRRGDMLTSLNKENNVLRDRIHDMEEVLVTIANWPNQEGHVQIRAMKAWAASVVDPTKVDAMKVLTTP